MRKHLENVKLWGRGSTMPSIPDKNVSGTLWAEPAALVFSSNNSSVVLRIPWEQIKECYTQWDIGDDLGTWLLHFCSFCLSWPKEWFIYLSWYDADHDMALGVWFFVGNAGLNSAVERKAQKLVKTIWKLRADGIDGMRHATAISYR